ncbi:hypothetical protein CPB83DRAFT_892962 [Crepidotus variabilis]|uniref:Uncharacterized protein n=1 Tax=Crepidotus variabilis TaxID=179855 RepID=A0A9P6EJE6_9AGAR|nr:hypothetical protein CPB83DRAFT_892962 [Crepidotus variabilis]
MSPESTATQNGSIWQSMKPWIPMLSLSVREITSVSATFILSAKLNESDPSLASLGLEAAASDNAEENPSEQKEETERVAIGSHGKKQSSVIADTLAKGLSVNVNGAAWPRAVIRIDDQLDEAVIIIFALMPGRQYDIELGLPHPGQSSTTLRRRVTTEDHSENDTAEASTDPESPTHDTHSASASSTSEPQSTPSTSPARTAPGTPPSSTVPVPQLTLEDRLNQLQHSLSLVNAERETLLSSLKSARRDAQKAESALRAEIETLKRTSEKNTSAELRGKQKVLALQESVKRAQNAAVETDEVTKELADELPELLKQKQAKEKLFGKIETEAGKIRLERDAVEEKEKKRLDGMKAELASLSNKLDKLNGKKKEKLETTIPDLEDKLNDVEQEILDAENELSQLEKEEQARMELEETYLSYQRVRHNSAGTIGRPSQAPIHRPIEPNSLWSSASIQRPVQTASNQTHTPRSQSLHTHIPVKPTHMPVLQANLNRQSSLKTTQTTSTPPGILPNLSILTSSSNASTLVSLDSTSTSGVSSSPTRASPNSIAASSTLSSLAPAFEPSRPINLKVTSGISSGPHQRSTTAVTAPPPPVGAGRPIRQSATHGHGPPAAYWQIGQTR